MRVRKNRTRGLYRCMTTIDDIEQLFRNNYKAMLIFANRLVHDGEVARDIVHDVFASLLSRDVRSVTPAYLISGVRYACLKHIRHTSVRERINKMYALDLQEIEDEEWPDDEDMARLRNGLRTQARFCSVRRWPEWFAGHRNTARSSGVRLPVAISCRG